MAPSSVQPLRTACKRFGPGRLPGAENHAVGAGYAAATAAICAAAIYAGVTSAVGPIGLEAAAFATVALAALALPIVVPAAYAIGYLGWTVVTPRSPAAGLIAGFLGALGTYALALVLFGIPVIVSEWLSGADPLRAAVFSWGVVYFAFLETWWAVLPVASVSGFVYTTVVHRVD